MTFISLPAAAALCEGKYGRRAAACRIWVAHLPPGESIAESARRIANECPPAPGRVHGLGDFVDPSVHESLLARLPTGLGLRLRERFEWYACRGAGFHNDAHYGGVLFGAWCVAGPPREIVFPRATARVGAAAGDLVVFDPFEPHAVLDPGHARYSREFYDGAPPSVFVGFEIELDAAARAAFDIGDPPDSGLALSSATPINAESGALPETPA
jgi:hypothetical protein